MTDSTYVRKNNALVNQDYNALRSAKAKREQAKRIERMDSKIQELEEKINLLEQTIKRLV